MNVHAPKDSQVAGSRCGGTAAVVRFDWTDVVIDYISAICGSQREATGRQEGKEGVQGARSPGFQLGPIATVMRVSPVAGLELLPWINVRLLQASPAPMQPPCSSVHLHASPSIPIPLWPQDI
jgi:hypothetical protein